ncbi:MAG: PD-(D/E)XK nuclease family protein [Spirosomaceae bacterium]|jgi:hypothetical protein|nr:PD-(D/E)XK nuclease family protein [Spirosomataceae bacterium]
MKFLQDSTKYIFEKHTTDTLKDICVVLPTRRAVFYFKRFLGQLSVTPFLAPKVYAIDDFVMEMSGVKQIDRVGLIFELFETFKEFDPQIDFDRFIAWASTLLGDFDTIDQYLLENPKSLFEFMSEAKALARWNLELQENPLDKITATTDKYFKLFENIFNVYNALKTRLSNKGLAYRGMAYRYLAEDVKQLILEQTSLQKFYFVGFNALSNSEERIIETLVKAKKAEVLWDTDDYYMVPKYEHRAGTLLRKYKMEGRFGQWNWQSNDLLTSSKNIRIIGLQNASLQAKLAGYFYAEELRQEQRYSTAIVLADESMLYPLMYSLDENVEDFNITMGLSLKNSMLFTLIDSIFELQQNIAEFKSKTGETYKIPKFSHRHISKILNHPFVRKYELLKYEGTRANKQIVNPIRNALREITKNNLVYLSESEMMNLGGTDKLFRVIFSRWNDDTNKAISSFEQLIDILREVYKESQDAIETEYLYLFLTILNRLDKVVKQQKEFKIRTFKHFLYELIKQERIPFSGEPVADLQIMSLLETRCLDFDRVILLSTNEGLMPAAKKNNSLIPFDACIEYQLPVHTDQDAIMSYHFFRLLQRAKEVDILYVLPSGEGVGGGGEKSRFIMQIENELVKLNPRINLSYPKIEWDDAAEDEADSTIIIQKNEIILNEISKHLSEKGIYPSHLSQYLRCSLQFYFNKIARVSKKEEIIEQFGADIFGNWLHKTLEDIDNDYKPIISEADAKQILTEVPNRLEKAYQDEFNGYVIDSGMNYLLKQVAEQILQDYFKFHIENKSFPLEVLSAEQNIEVFFEPDILGKPQKIKIAGRVDRIERDETLKLLKVVDYKTGMVRSADLRPEKDQPIVEALLDPDKDKFRQLWLYQYLMLKAMKSKTLEIADQKLENYDVKAKIYSFRNIKENLEVDIEFTENQSIDDFIDSSESLLTDFATELLNPHISFTQTNDLEVCDRCDFKGICGR